MPGFDRLIGRVSAQLSAIAAMKCLLATFAAYIVLYAIPGLSCPLALAGTASVFGAMAMFSGLIRNQREQAIKIIHRRTKFSEFSLDLYKKRQLNIAEQLQLERIDGLYDTNTFSHRALYSGLTVYAVAVIVALILSAGVSFLNNRPSKSAKRIFEKNPAKLAVAVNPEITSMEAIINSPTYTAIPEKRTSDMNISAISGAQIGWDLTLSNNEDAQVKLVNTLGKELIFQKRNKHFHYSDKIAGSGLYAFRVYKDNKIVYESEYYKLVAIADIPPEIEPDSKELYRFLLIKDNKTIHISASISDDFKVSRAYIVATLARGSGENVKFREVRFPLEGTNFKKAKLGKTIDLDQLGFSPGDELYYYWAAFDNKTPVPNFSKSDSYFLVYKDTAQVDEAALATMAVNLVPEYFRSQRQIIIDTEKLLARSKKIATKEFNETSNEIGFDQKVLRMRYGQYLGEEFETSIGGASQHDDDGQGAGIVDAFTHHSDGKGEGAADRPVEPERHEHQGNKSDSKDPLAALMEQYVHNHDDGEANTFYEQSTRSLLKMALEQMWQSELHLRIYEPAKALPYEHRALEYLKLAQQKARTYAKKSGFDPPPIKEREKRLTGEMKDLTSDLKQKKEFEKYSIPVLAATLTGYLDNQKADHKMPESIRYAASVLSQRLVDASSLYGMRNWSELKLLQKMLNGKALSADESDRMKAWLYRLSDKEVKNRQEHDAEPKLREAFWKNMEL